MNRKEEKQLRKKATELNCKLVRQTPDQIAVIIDGKKVELNFTSDPLWVILEKTDHGWLYCHFVTDDANAKEGIDNAFKIIRREQAICRCRIRNRQNVNASLVRATSERKGYCNG